MSTKEVYSVSMPLTNSTFFAEFDLNFFKKSLLYFFPHDVCQTRSLMIIHHGFLFSRMKSPWKI